jgi:hypothetical protein
MPSVTAWSTLRTPSADIKMMRERSTSLCASVEERLSLSKIERWRGRSETSGAWRGIRWA